MHPTILLRNTLFFFCLFAGLTLSAQKKFKALYLPPSLDKIQDVNEYRDNYAKLISVDATRGETRGRLWMVVCDRAGTKVFDKPDGQAGQSLRFKQGPFYVIDQKDNWVEIVSGRPDGKIGSNKVDGKYVGWVRKTEMLMWPGALRAGSGLTKFVFILTRTEDIDKIKDLKVSQASLYNTPDPSAEPYDKIQLFSFYNVLKQEGTRFLIAELEDGILPGNENLIGDAIKGWVDIKNTTPWNTRLVLEPNFSEAGFKERKANPNFRLVGYAEGPDAFKHAREGTVAGESIWSSDPVIRKPEELSAKNAYRFKGSVMRFPMLSGSSNGASSVFKTGIIGDVKLENNGKIDDVARSVIEESLKKEAEDRKNVNLLFAIQGTANMRPYKDDILEAIRNIEGAYSGAGYNVRYGGVVYHNIMDGDETDDSLAKVFPLSTSKESFVSFVSDIPFDNKNSDANRNAPAINFGLNRLLKRANLNSQHSNILIIIGSDGDFASSRATLRLYPNHRAVVDPEKVVGAVEGSNTQVFTIATTVKGRSGSDLLNLAQDLTNSSAKQIYNKEIASIDEAYLEAVGKPEAPNLRSPPDEISSPMEIMIDRSSVDGGMIFPADGQAIQDIQGKILKIGKITKLRILNDWEIYKNYGDGKKIGEISKDFEAVIKNSEDGLTMTAGNFNAQVQAKLGRILQRVNIPPDMLGNRYQVYEEVYFSREIKGASEPAMSFVLFMPFTQVAPYIDVINTTVNDASRQSPDMQREAIVDLYDEMYFFFTGNRTPRTDLLQNRISEITSKMFGMAADGLVCPKKAQYYCDLQLGDIMQPDKVTDQEVEKILKHFKDVVRYLESTVLRPDYDFVFTSRTDRQYVWIPLDYLY